MEKKRIVIIGAGCFQKALIEKAKEMGVETHVFAWLQGAEGIAAADFFYPVSIMEKEKILKICRNIRPHAVATIASELGNITVQYLAEHLGLPANTKECIKKTTNKAAMRRALKESGMPVPDFWVLDEHEGETWVPPVPYPLIVKPTDRSGSRGVCRAENERELRRALREALGQSFEKRVIVETLIAGDEYSCECISFRGVHKCLGITRKYTTGSPQYVETGHIEPAGLTPRQEMKIKEQVFRALTVLKVENGASHTELRMDSGGNIRLIEAGSRMGGDCIGSDLIPLATGIDYVKNVILTALGECPKLDVSAHFEAAAVRFLIRGKDAELPGRIQADRDLQLIYVSPNSGEDRAVTDSTARSGYVIFAGRTYEAVRTMMEELYEEQVD